MLAIASTGVAAETVYVGILEVKDQWKGPGGWDELDHHFNGSDYNGPYENFWPPDSILNFSISMEVYNTCGLTTDFKWVIHIDQEGADDYDIYIEDDAGVHNQDASHWVNGVAQFGDVTIDGYIEIVPEQPWHNINITATCTPYRNSIPVGTYCVTPWAWIGPI